MLEGKAFNIDLGRLKSREKTAAPKLSNRPSGPVRNWVLSLKEASPCCKLEAIGPDDTQDVCLKLCLVDSFPVASQDGHLSCAERQRLPLPTLKGQIEDFGHGKAIAEVPCPVLRMGCSW